MDMIEFGIAGMMFGYGFKRSHSCAYSQLVVVHMNLLSKQERKGARLFN